MASRMRSVTAGPTNVHVAHLLVEDRCVWLRGIRSTVAAAGCVSLRLEVLLLKGFALSPGSFEQPSLLVIMRGGTVLLLVWLLLMSHGDLLRWLRTRGEATALNIARIGGFSTCGLSIAMSLLWVKGILNLIVRAGSGLCLLDRVGMGGGVGRMLRVIGR